MPYQRMQRCAWGQACEFQNLDSKLEVSVHYELFLVIRSNGTSAKFRAFG